MHEPTKWIIIAEILYLILLLAVCLRIIWDTRSVSKTMGYLLLVIFVPFFGIFFYFSFGINYRKRNHYQRKLQADEKFLEDFRKEIDQNKTKITDSSHPSLSQYQSLITLFSNPEYGYFSPAFPSNQVQILINGEAFFPLLKEKLNQAKQHIHIEFYIYENDQIGNEIKDILIQKAKEGVEVRFIFDDFGSKGIRGKFAKELKKNGVNVFPFNRIYLIALANRLNYRNHRKIVVIDGETSFIGGINVSDKYSNPSPSGLFWRDTHLMIKGEATYGLQHIFLSDWNFCSGENLKINSTYFPKISTANLENCPLQIISDGPDTSKQSILNSILKVIGSTQNELLITTPYNIPDDALQQALILASLSGVDVKILVPKKGDSALVSLASRAYFEELLEAGVKIYLYTKGFVHAKTFVTDRKLASIGTANLDVRSFDLNFEVTSFIYDQKQAEYLAQQFFTDLIYAEELNYSDWKIRPQSKKFIERVVRLLSPFL